MQKLRSVGVWAVAILAALAFVSAGVFKLLGTEALHLSFATMGLPVWFGYFIGLAEVLGGLGLLVRRTATWSAAGLFIIMLGAIYFHLAYAVPSAVPAVVLAGFVFIVGFVRRKDAIGNQPLRRAI